MKRFLILLVLVTQWSCGQKKMELKGDTEWQNEKNAQFKDASTSPLTKKDLRTFEGLDFFEFDSTYVVNAFLERTPNTEWFKMKTTTDRLSEERVYGILQFEIGDQSFSLNVYQGKENMQTEGYEDYLFLPYLDNTNGVTSYGGGRYIDLRIPKGNEIIVDFNKSYNPLCVYNKRYSCPIVPRINYMDIEVKAGMKDYKKE
ncbi:DUF1684 domain-containing protein [Winogradskyella maritima]|uniref:DUF1684 domain-containing protein n=1 Tax=Winogradskyella maritima TaxID=1517766 RepID=A0ABV8AK29_9FLAO|nr:DUF1684 domain-containing protein [Winogradskyella maritima]